MRPKLLRRWTGYVADISAVSLFLICEHQNEQFEVSASNVPRVLRDRLRDGACAQLLVYENRVAFRLLRVGRWTTEELRRARKRGRRLMTDLRDRARVPMGS